MSPLLDIYINHWTEDWEIGEKAFRMLALQRGVDWSRIRVTVVHDGSPAFPEAFFEGLPFEVRQVELMHGGIAKARNWCIDDGDGEWIKWCDWDDCFAGIYGLRDIVHVLETGKGYDLLWFDLLFEYMDGRVFLRDKYDPVLVHGKVIRRSFLREHGIRFPEHLTWCEDSAMLAVCEMEIGKTRKGKIRSCAPIYAYICRNGSLCNRPEIRFDNRKSFYRRHRYVQDEMEKRGLETERRMMTLRTLADNMYTMEQAGLAEDMSAFGAETLKYYKAHKQDLAGITRDEFQFVLDAVNMENEGCNITRDGFLEWLRRLKFYEGGDNCSSMT